MAESDMPKFRVAIVGAGLTGVFLAVCLEKYAPNVEFDIYEGASQMLEIGAGIVMQSRPWTMMQATGLDKDLLKIAGDGERPAVVVLFRKSDQVDGFQFSQQTDTDTSYPFHRGEVHKAFLDRLHASDRIHLRKRFVSYVQPANGMGPIEVRFQDGTTATCDILVGADGVRSAVRASMYSQLAQAAEAEGKQQEADDLKHHISPVFSGATIYRTVINKTGEIAAHPAFNRSGLVFYCGKDKHLLTYPISQGRILNVAAVIRVRDQEGDIYPGPWSSVVNRDEYANEFKGWEPDVGEIVKHMDNAQKWAINVVTKLPTYVDGRVALLGDAAHGMGPHQGAGAGQGFEDGFLLAQFLGRPEVTRETMQIALQVYDEIRRPLSQKVAAFSHMSGMLHLLQDPERISQEDEPEHELTLEELRKIGDKIERVKDWRRVSSLLDESKVSMQRLMDAVSTAQTR
ncbi:FAD/NAD(P)-binding domain-containing protein [Lentinus tigrinus ALCF2SS1-7]|uniref:FAD/NAD(P)-binding domain-containing protein n=1 Tax=Lentinus tigrinus ALCF2SS1-6 TaxID=1328759 RepID=A0A5C2SE89_9APHY|nr:FAD/NAD(P)-binding domain-containing protein [Lentinus tigrinus ALCF2SS1-6]RPD74591.1 FAD/NAD(P)-binding domain-containing protein [Lentinus tigrinus ALCF2SS1-7]